MTLIWDRWINSSFSHILMPACSHQWFTVKQMGLSLLCKSHLTITQHRGLPFDPRLLSELMDEEMEQDWANLETALILKGQCQLTYIENNSNVFSVIFCSVYWKLSEKAACQDSWHLVFLWVWLQRLLARDVDLYLLWQHGWYCFHLLSLCVCLCHHGNMWPGDTNCNRNNHGSAFEFAAKCIKITHRYKVGMKMNAES